MKRNAVGAVVLLMVVGGILVPCAHADLVRISSLYNTGVANDGVLANGAVDSHYTVVRNEGGVPAGSPTYAWNGEDGGWPVGRWLADSAASAWISPYMPVVDPVQDVDPNGAGNYLYTTTFDLAGIDFASASIAGRWSSDNTGRRIYLNGVDVSTLADSYVEPVGGYESFGRWFNFGINSGFVSGINTLQFTVNNSNGPTGLRVEMNGFATTPVPEPASAVLLGLGITGLAVKRARRKRG